MIQKFINFITTKKTNMNENENVPNDAQETSPEVENNEVTTEVESTETETTPEEKAEVKSTNERELTDAVLEKAKANFSAENPDKTWEEVDQDTRWSYLAKAY